MCCRAAFVSAAKHLYVSVDKFFAASSTDQPASRTGLADFLLPSRKSFIACGTRYEKLLHKNFDIDTASYCQVECMLRTCLLMDKLIGFISSSTDE